MDFNQFKPLFQKHFEEMTRGVTTLYEVDVDKEEFWNLYLDSFPAGKNEIYRTRREYDCSCCRHFFRDFGNVVVIKDQKITTLWDFHPNDDTFEPVMRALNEYILSRPVTECFVTKNKKIGTDRSREYDENGCIVAWDHFYLELPMNFVSRSGKSIPELKGEIRDTRNVFKRSMDEITMDAIDTVLELIQSNTLYRGAEQKETIKQFKEYKAKYDKLPAEKKDLFAWEFAPKVGSTVGRIRNHSIGVLLTNISQDMDLDAAVREYERIVAPENYKRPNAIFTKKMLENAKKTISDLGYMESLPRRHATLDDITVNNILFSNKDAAKRIAGADVFDEMISTMPVDPKKFSRAEEISIDKFISDVLPTAREVDVFVENRHAKNMVSLIAPVNPDAKTMFKWNNGFSWAYTGNLADSNIRENVKRAGGNIDGKLRFSIQWNDEDEYNGCDYDAHCKTPSGEIYYAHKTCGSGSLDVDITHPSKNTPAVENIVWPREVWMKPGEYSFFVHCYCGREGNKGFRAELEVNGEVYQYDYRRSISTGSNVSVAVVSVDASGNFTVKEKLKSATSSRDVWGIQTQQFVPASVIMYSPNYWDEQLGNGNRHYFFMLKDCVNTEEPNGFYNEYLKADLLQHKRVLEALGSKMAVEKVDDQLSGLGFSSTVRNELLVKVKGATERIMKIKF